ncbi:hypothetical protein DSECCO2_213260 [anaerobic digester metagenome]
MVNWMQKQLRKSVDVQPDQMMVWRAPLRDGAPEAIHIRVPVSSGVVDRDGDQFSDRGLQSLAAAYNSGRVPVFPNHGQAAMFGPYYAFEDAFGVWYRGEVEDGKVYATAALDPHDWRAQLIEHRLNMGLPVAFSVGFIPIETEPHEGGGVIFHTCDLLETSPVGIPANPDAVAIRAVVKSMLNAAGITVPDDADIPANLPGGSESDPVTDKELKEKQPDEGEEEEQEEEDKTKPCDEDDERKQPEEEPDEEEEEEEEKAFEILDEAAVRAIVADEMGKALAPVLARLKTLDEVKAIVERAATVPKGKGGPRAIVIAREVEPEQKTNTEPAGKPDIIIP